MVWRHESATHLLLIGIQPEYRAKGANALLFADLITIYQKYGIERGEKGVITEVIENR